MVRRMRKAQLFSQDIIFAMTLVLFIFSMWLILRDRVLYLISASEYKRDIDEVTSNALSQLLETSGKPTSWNRLSAINETTVESMGIASERNVLDPEKTEKFIDLASDEGTNYTIVKKLLGLDKSGYAFNFTISYLNGTSLYNATHTPSNDISMADYAALNTTVVIERFALLNDSLVKVTLGVWIE